ncbi:MAG: DUF86 domain-containing protein [Nodosilinea sp. WJT8-NPBG4]|nr:DUF86 domain-containing protein [Nodosilinea sp. WJT8-NPBG4]
MSSRDWLLRIHDILTAISAIQARTSAISFEVFEDDETVLKAVLYDFIIIGEASANIPDEIQQRYSDLPWRLMKDMRNIAAHEYFQLDTPTIWRTIHRSLPPLVEPLQSILEREQPS